MKLLIGIMVLLILIGLAGSVQVGGTAQKPLLLGSLSKNALSQANALNDTNITNQTNITITGRSSGAIAIKNPMSIYPVSRTLKGTSAPNSIQSNAITYQFTT